MTRDEALKLVEEHLKNKNIVKHCLALEAVMRAFAEFYGEDPEKWALAGLLHDLDYEKTAQEPQKHGIVTEDILKEKGVDQKIIDIIQAHNSDVLGTLRDTKAKKVIYSADPLTGLIVACALIRPEKKLASIDTQFVLNRFKEKSFAAGASRGIIQKCEELDLSLEEFTPLEISRSKRLSPSRQRRENGFLTGFIDISLKAMQGISKELGL